MMLYRWNEVEYSTVCQSLKMDKPIMSERVRVKIKLVAA